MGGVCVPCHPGSPWRSRGPGAPSGPAGKRASAGERQELPVGHSSGAQDEAQALGPGSWALWGWEPSVTRPPSRRRVPGKGRQCRSPAGVQGRVCASVRRGQVMPADRQRRVAEAQAAKVCLSLWSLGPRLGGSAQPFPVPGEQGTRRRWGKSGTRGSRESIRWQSLGGAGD